MVFNATRTDQAVVQGDARDLADRVEAAGLEGPAIVMVGDALGRGGREVVFAEALASAAH